MKLSKARWEILEAVSIIGVVYSGRKFLIRDIRALVKKGLLKVAGQHQHPGGYVSTLLGRLTLEERGSHVAINGDESW